MTQQVSFAKAKFDVVLVREATAKEHKVFTNSESGFKDFMGWLEERTSKAWVCMESTGCYGEALAEYLISANIRVSVANALQVKNFSKALLSRNKNDRSKDESAVAP